MISEEPESVKRPTAEPDAAVEEIAHAVIGAAIEVHRALGPGYLESLYEEALAIEFESRGVPFVRQHPISVKYRGRTVGEGKADFLAAGRVIVELKAVERLLPIHKAQVISYLKATKCVLGLLLNFNTPIMRDGVQRIVLS